MSQPTKPPPVPPADETTLADVKQLGLWASIASLSYVFWVVGGMEMIERLAFYGVRAVATLYATRPAVHGRAGGDDGHVRHAAAVLESRSVAHSGVHRRPVRPLRLQADDLRLDGHQVRWATW